MPRISVIVPAYNAQDCLEKCIESILAQSFADLELIVIDDGSKDDTAAICDLWAAKDSRVKVMYEQKDYCIANVFSSAGIPVRPFIVEL